MALLLPIFRFTAGSRLSNHDRRRGRQCSYPSMPEHTRVSPGKGPTSFCKDRNRCCLQCSLLTAADCIRAPEPLALWPPSAALSMARFLLSYSVMSLFVLLVSPESLVLSWGCVAR
ncbi:hypothetical protein BDW69DRAFT_158979 [Aspergillus filifer]